jgi:uncharacterized protein (TIGR03437 family)
MFGVFEVASRGSQFNYQNRNQSDIVNRLLSRFQETGSGEIGKAEPTQFDTAWQVNSTFELDPVVNVPGFGVAPGEAITVYGVGFGALPGDLAAGVPPSVPYMGNKSDITFQLGGKPLPPENILEYELPAGTIGFWQVKLLIPADTAPGDFVPLSAAVKGVPTAAGAPATIAIRPKP